MSFHALGKPPLTTAIATVNIVVKSHEMWAIPIFSNVDVINLVFWELTGFREREIKVPPSLIILSQHQMMNTMLKVHKGLGQSRMRVGVTVQEERLSHYRPKFNDRRFCRLLTLPISCSASISEEQVRLRLHGPDLRTWSGLPTFGKSLGRKSTSHAGICLFF